ncbi:amidohydrolase [Brevundimonas sp. SORGH_AS_0993]|uniref:amidohydrolase n=1 Tax=Brevundimonas sp. SORGH_AS_0993 TaxID=3041794 RepID=UPI0027824CB9|nr:amidohydrolase [Brevundimonas sp. SORGH_AS_0993]MDQ1154487.1 amidohydrolase [Brevundimonas sp. SORGH_AS_0993]
MSETRDWFARHGGEIVEWRRDIHAHPELAFQERRTAGFVAERLRTWGLEVHEGIAETGVIGVLRGAEGTQAPAIGLRADMDALPIEEATEIAYRSKHSGVMHACGHDGHTALLLGAARRIVDLTRTRGPFPGDIVFIFQPAEENEGGGRRMVEQGLFDRFPVRQVFALHNMPDLEIGRFITRAGAMLAGFDTFDVRVEAEGGHAAFPAVGGDAVVAAAALVMGFQTIVPRQTPASAAALLAVTMIAGGSAHNVLPDVVTLGGSLRWFERPVIEEIRCRMQAHCRGVETAYGVKVILDYQERYPALVNDVASTDLAARAARRAVGEDRVATDIAPIMGSEDFAFMLERTPGAYLGFGNGPGTGGCLLHNPRYDFNDAALETGVAFWTALVETFFEDMQTA